MTTTPITYGQLSRLLLDLGFVDSPTKRHWTAFHHAQTETLIVLPLRPTDSPARETHIVSLRRHLVEKGLIGESEFDRVMQSVVSAIE